MSFFLEMLRPSFKIVIAFCVVTIWLGTLFVFHFATDSHSDNQVDHLSEFQLVDFRKFVMNAPISSGKAAENVTCLPLPFDFADGLSFFPCHFAISKSKVQCKFRLQVSLDCHKSEPGVLFKRVPSEAEPYQVPAKDRCLIRVIQTRCFDKGFLVPRVVHYVSLGSPKFHLCWFICVLSAVRYYRPCLVLFHGDSLPVGIHWRALLQLLPHVIFVKGDVPTSIFGNPINDTHHRSDIIRLYAMTEYGGLYLDSDHWLVNRVDDLRKKPAAIGMEYPERICNSIYMAAPNATFLHRWREAYRDFDDKAWAHHSGYLPMQIALKFPREVHVTKTFFTLAHKDLKPLYDHNSHYDWSNTQAIHLYRRYFISNFDQPPQLKNSSYGDLARRILFGSKDRCFHGNWTKRPVQFIVRSNIPGLET